MYGTALLLMNYDTMRLRDMELALKVSSAPCVLTKPLVTAFAEPQHVQRAPFARAQHTVPGLGEVFLA